MFPFYNEYNLPRPPSCLMVNPPTASGGPPRESLFMPTSQNSNANFEKPWWKVLPENHSRSVNKTGKRKFQLNLDVQHFNPQDISVKTENGFIVVEAKHGERPDQHGFISRGFSRRYELPESIEPSMVVSKLSSDGILNITAPLTVPPRSDNERDVPIVRTGPVRTPPGAEER